MITRKEFTDKRYQLQWKIFDAIKEFEESIENIAFVENIAVKRWYLLGGGDYKMLQKIKCDIDFYGIIKKEDLE